MRVLARWLLVVLALLLPAGLARAEEAITSFKTRVTLGADGTVDVVETITVMAEGNQIRRGIFRDIPTQLQNPDGSMQRSGLDVLSVSRDGSQEPFEVESITRGKRIRIGDADVFLTYGQHTYTIHYTMTRMGRMFADHDELYWNATGNFWDFRILSAEAEAVLPEGARITDITGYTGPLGSTEQALTSRRLSDNRAQFTASRVLGAGEGMTIAVAFAKGILVEPTGAQGGLNWLSDHRNDVLPALGVLAVLLYNGLAWFAVGRDPRKGVIIPRFHAPNGLSPALVHYIHRWGFQGVGWQAFTAAIFNLGVKGLVTIDNPGKVLKVTSTGKVPDPADLGPGERVLEQYFRTEHSVTVNTANGPALAKKRGEFTAAIERENRKVFFVNNALFSVLGFLLGIAIVGILVWLEVIQVEWLLVAVIAGFALGIVTSVIKDMISGFNFVRFVAAGFVIFGGLNIFTGLGSLLTDFSINPGIVGTISIIAITLLFAQLMRAPTVSGRKVMDEIDGFKLYLETAEKNRLNIVNEPPMTVERFERILPFAIALGVEKPWSQHFEGELARNAVADAQSGSYSPGWYSGRNFSSGGLSNTVASVATGMSAAMMAAQPASSSSSGFSSGGGGGSSGGGGGGGGGGGW